MSSSTGKKSFKQFSLGDVLEMERSRKIPRISVVENEIIEHKGEKRYGNARVKFDLLAVYHPQIKDRMGTIPVEFKIDWMKRILSEFRKEKTPRLRDVAEVHKLLDTYLYLILNHKSEMDVHGDLCLNLYAWNLPHDMRGTSGTWVDDEAKSYWDKPRRLSLILDPSVKEEKKLSPSSAFYDPYIGKFLEAVRHMHEIPSICRVKGVHSLFTPDNASSLLNVHPKLLQIKNSKMQTIVNVLLENMILCIDDFKKEIGSREFKNVLKEMQFESYLQGFLRSPYFKDALYISNFEPTSPYSAAKTLDPNFLLIKEKTDFDPKVRKPRYSELHRLFVTIYYKTTPIQN